MDLASYIRTVPDWPKPGVMFRDITTLLKDSKGFSQTIDYLVGQYALRDIEMVAGIESRGFIIGSALAHRLQVGFVPVRKAGKLPAAVFREEYALEYGKDRVEIHQDAVAPGQRVLLVDDLIATGGTALAAASLIQRLHGELVGCAFVIELPDLKGREKLEERGYEVFSLMRFEGE